MHDLRGLRRLRAQASRGKGFTLIEILIVISIIAILMSFVAGGVMLVKKRAAAAITTTLISQISSALDRFYEDEGYYPGGEYTDIEENAFPAVYEALLGERKPKGKGGRRAPYIDNVKEHVIVVKDSDEPGGYRKANSDEKYDKDLEKFIIDEFGLPLWFRLNKGRDRESYMKNPHKFDIWSTGPDKLNQTLTEEPKSDDIGNW